MSKIYELTLEMEVLGEYAASTLAMYSRFFDNSGIDWRDETNEFVKLELEVLNLKNLITKQNSLEELLSIENRIRELRNIAEKEIEKCQKSKLNRQ
ncbi:hypothetical protein FACS1894132_14770 [Clostridia bacterium]|nr:hypothetical protein FACS1894132_14770 [Clostridia bacterium]